jgi:hypothetical protein
MSCFHETLSLAPAPGVSGHVLDKNVAVLVLSHNHTRVTSHLIPQGFKSIAGGGGQKRENSMRGKLEMGFRGWVSAGRRRKVERRRRSMLMNQCADAQVGCDYRRCCGGKTWGFECIREGVVVGR